MTEQQIKQLRELLADSRLDQHSAALDQEILDAALHGGEPQAANSAPVNRFWNVNLLPIGALQIAFALVITLGLFFGMSQLISVDRDPESVARRSPTLTIENTKVTQEATPGAASVVEKPQRPTVLTQPESGQLSDDLILMEYDLPNTRDVLAQLNFQQDQERAWAEQNIALALNDIREMIGTGALDTARQRYARLKQQCHSCNLPSTLEALLMNEQGRYPLPSNDTG